MRLAITIWENRVSPLCDSARLLSIFDVDGGRVDNERRISIETGHPFTLVSRLSELKVDVLICGGISESLSARMDQYGIRVMPFISGQADQILRAFCSEQLDRPVYRMPGYGRGRKQHFRRRLGGRRGRSGNIFNL